VLAHTFSGAWRTALVLLWVWPTGGPLSAQGDCSSCHDQGPKLQKSAHAALSCDTCHQDHDKFPHPENASKPECASCHVDEAKDYARSVHGMTAKKGNEAADCSVCHGDAAVAGGLNPDLRHSSVIGSAEAVRSVVIDGALQHNGMVSFRAALSPADAEATRQYLIKRANEDKTLGER